MDIVRNKVQDISETLSTEDVTEETIQEIGEDLSELLGRVIEAKIVIENIIINLE